MNQRGTEAFAWYTRFLVVLGIVVSGGFEPSVAQNDKPTDSKKNVLILYGERLDLPAIRAAEQSLRETFAASAIPQIEWFAEYFDFARFPTAQHEANLTRYLRERYAARKIDLIMPVSTRSLHFLLRHRKEIFPGVPVVYAAQSAAEVDVGALPPDVTGVAAEMDARGTLDLALRLQPEAREIVCVSGAAETDQDALAEETKVLEGYGDRLQVRVVSRRSLAQTIEEVRAVPRGQIVLLISMTADSEGRALSTREVARQLSAVSQAPIYGVWGTIMDTGAVGGALIDFAAVGRKAAEVALKVLGGARVAIGSPETKARAPLIVDWRALKHWKLPVSHLPAEAVMMFRPPTLWEEHRGLMIAIATVLVVQTSLIVALLVELHRRRLAEAALRESDQRMSLAVTASNFGIWIRDFARNEIWASDKWRELFGFTLKRNDLETRPLDVGELVGDVASLARADAAARQVKLDMDVASGLPLVRGDRVHLQQVLLNLVLNGMDALNGSSRQDRRVSVTARLEGAQTVEIAASDTGHGIPPTSSPTFSIPFSPPSRMV